ncbi:MAG: outer membrane beta-barrel protein [Bacteroidia bacterium]|jgi:hypothetical protein|nr:outer membrane beta-barrel protein [Bacteroidia bacterium]
MLKALHSVVFGVTVFFTLYSRAAGVPNSHFGSRIRFHLGPGFGFYTINPNHAADPKQKFNFLLGVNKEFSLGRDYKTFFLVGVDYFYHGLGFKSYYFPPDTLQLYNKDFQYDYSLQIHELQLPLQFKYLFKPEHNSLFSPYVCVAYHLRYLLPSQLKVSYFGNIQEEEAAELKFKTPLFDEQLNAAVSLSLGWQKNSLASSKGSFYVEANLRYNFSPYYFEKSYAASSLYINSTHLIIQLGIRF